MKKILSITLCLALILTSMTFNVQAETNDNKVIMVKGLSMTALADETQIKTMDTLDLIIAAGSYLNSEIPEEQCIGKETFINNSTPLFSSSGKIVAYYVSFLPNGYAVINNNVENPTVIEFGVERNPIIEEILNQSNNPHIVYNNPVDIYDANLTIESQIKPTDDIFTYYPDLAEKNPILSSRHNMLKEFILQQQSMMRGDGDFGFIDVFNMPYGAYRSDTITSASSTDWAIMDEFNSIANNHCGATAVTNLALYFAQRGYSNLKINTRLETFKAVHKIVGNGPTMMIAGSTKAYFKDRGYTLNYSSVSDFSGIKSAVENNRPSGVLLADGLFSWHWILAVGYREYYNDGNYYMQVMDGWYDTIGRYYKINTGSTWISATQYWVE